MLHGCSSRCPRASLIVMSQVTVKRFEILLELPECYTEYEMSKCCWKNGADRLALRRGATDLQLVKTKKTKKKQKNTKLLLSVKQIKEACLCMTAIDVTLTQMCFCFTSSEFSHIASLSVLTLFYFAFSYFNHLTCVEREQT